MLQSLSAFLHVALASPYSSSTNSSVNPAAIPMNTWYLASSFTNREAYDVFDQLLQPSLQSSTNSSHRQCWQSEVDLQTSDDNFVPNCPFAESPCNSHWTFKHLSDVVDVLGGLTDADASRMADSTFVAVRMILSSKQI